MITSLYFNEIEKDLANRAKCKKSDSDSTHAIKNNISSTLDLLQSAPSNI